MENIEQLRKFDLTGLLCFMPLIGMMLRFKLKNGLLKAR